jgi:hypothetical protein
MEQAELTPEESFLTDLAQGAITGATTGAVAGPWGALVGAIAGAGLSAVQSATQPQRPQPPPPRPPAPPPAPPATPPTVTHPRPAPAPPPAPTPPAAPTPPPAPTPSPPALAPSAPGPVAPPAPPVAPAAGFDLQQLMPAIMSLAQTLGSALGRRPAEDVETASVPPGMTLPPERCGYGPPPGVAAIPAGIPRAAPSGIPASMHGHMMESLRYAEAAEVAGGTPSPRTAIEAAWAHDDGEASWVHDDGEAAWAHDDGEADDEATWRDDEALPFVCTWDR